ncbi:hypothetical protein BJ684DRAFT_19435 [Piptocephalis cylindrospora]|uniref:Uncharacterized protein n=1 Tax=Piptocephalis cylindrospora TaxID=1907219 RepID=A0A4P9Y5W1_9FUNG|nr:hypothetical protein BJ684DRAFT_19435 [Piptocephalis cylindrospora]|eukprot:RKP14142.1 hypothetical protein BJ684DRAFT_19435 [Piptocephalis cylindrospora]
MLLLGTSRKGKAQSLPFLLPFLIVILISNPFQPTHVLAGFPGASFSQMVQGTKKVAVAAATKGLAMCALPKLILQGVNPKTGYFLGFKTSWMQRMITDDFRSARYGAKVVPFVAQLLPMGGLMGGQMALMAKLAPQPPPPGVAGDEINNAAMKYSKMADAASRDISDLTEGGTRILLRNNMTLGNPTILDLTHQYSANIVNLNQVPDLTKFGNVGALLHVDPSFYVYQFDSPPTGTAEDTEKLQGRQQGQGQQQDQQQGQQQGQQQDQQQEQQQNQQQGQQLDQQQGQQQNQQQGQQQQ